MNWTVDYGSGPEPVTIPHAWRQDVPVTWEGPAIYETEVTPATDQDWLVFHGVSYQARIELDGQPQTDHRGLWDAFAVKLGPAHQPQKVKVEVVKNGGPTFPVKQVLSGFLPYVFNPFGGIFRPVEVVTSEQDPTLPKPKPTARIAVEDHNLKVDGENFYMRGVLSWGWYPNLGNHHPDLETCRDECRKVKELGFNLIKFCLWLPPHHFFQALEEHGLFAWVELPLWDPQVSDPSDLVSELKRIVLRYRHHTQIIAWTIGCELNAALTPETLKDLVDFVQTETGCPLVKDNSGSAEMYSSQMREYGTFRDFHPYCDTPFYRPVLESLRHGPRPDVPILLGEFNDYDHARNLPALKAEDPFYMSLHPNLNDQGVRWQHDFPSILHTSKLPDLDYPALIRYAISKGHFIRKKVHEAVRQTPEIAGYCITGLVDTPISTSGMLDDHGNSRYGPQHVTSWNQPYHLGLLPFRTPPWVNGGNRPGWRDTQNYFSGGQSIQITGHAEPGFRGVLVWRIESGPMGEEPVQLGPCEPKLLTQIDLDLPIGKHLLVAELQDHKGNAVHHDSWPIWIHENAPLPDPWIEYDPQSPPPTDKNLLILNQQTFNQDFFQKTDSLFVATLTGSLRAPFWRECVFDYPEPNLVPFANNWEKLFCVSGDSFLTDQDLAPFTDIRPLMVRWDTRTYQKSYVIVAVKTKKSAGILTTLNLNGGIGAQPTRPNNPAAHTITNNLIVAVTTIIKST